MNTRRTNQNLGFLWQGIMPVFLVRLWAANFYLLSNREDAPSLTVSAAALSSLREREGQRDRVRVECVLPRKSRECQQPARGTNAKEEGQ